MKSRPKVKFNIPICLAAVLLCLTLFSFYFSGGLYAKYVTRASGSDSARVAKFDVSIQSVLDIYSEMIPLGDIQPGDSKTIEFTVTNNSEVAVAFIATVTNLTGNLPLDIPLSGVPQNLAPGENKAIELTVSWDKNKSDPANMGKTDLLNLRIVVEQID